MQLGRARARAAQHQKELAELREVRIAMALSLAQYASLEAETGASEEASSCSRAPSAILRTWRTRNAAHIDMASSTNRALESCGWNSRRAGARAQAAQARRRQNAAA